MRGTIDAAGRVVIPKPLRDRLGIRPGEVELIPDGTGGRIEPLARKDVVELRGRLVIPPPTLRSTTISSARCAMPTSADAELLVDTSVAVALMVSDHKHHEAVTLAGVRLGLSGHAAFETFSVLTRLPPPLRRTPGPSVECCQATSSDPGSWRVRLPGSCSSDCPAWGSLAERSTTRSSVRPPRTKGCVSPPATGAP